MDPLEQQALEDPVLSKSTDKETFRPEGPVSSEGMGGADFVPGTEGGTPAAVSGAPPQSSRPLPRKIEDLDGIPEDELKRGYLRQADHTRKMQALAEERRQVQELMAQNQKISQYLLQQIQATSRQPASEQSKPRSFEDYLPPSLRESLIPEQRQVLEAWDTLQATREDELRKELNQLVEERLRAVTEPLARQIQDQFWHQRKSQWANELEQLRREFGDEVVSAHQQQLEQMLIAAPRASAKQLLAFLDPDLLVRQGQARALREASARTSQAANAEIVAGGPTGRPTPTGRSSGSPPRRPGTSFREDLRQVLQEMEG